jgi:mRNA (guanine-N7-)-methyltransferase
MKNLFQFCGPPQKGRCVVDLMERSEAATEVAGRYNALPNGGSVRRPVQKFNNAVKRCLLSLFLPRRGMVVLDMAGGKGGDLGKFSDLGVGMLVHADLAEVSVQHAEERRMQLGITFPIVWVVADCFGENIVERLNPETQFDLVSCQFALHYGFESEARLRIGLQNISGRLKKGGHFCGTVPNADRLVELLRHASGLRWSNSICSVDFDSATNKESLPDFGAKYSFSLDNCLDSVPEYLVPFAVLQRVALEYGLELVLKQDFFEFFQSQRDDKVRFNLRSLSDDEKHVAALYVVFAFRKT